jgi:Rrf2 family protein
MIGRRPSGEPLKRNVAGSVRQKFGPSEAAPSRPRYILPPYLNWRMLSKKAKYAIKALVALADQQSEEPVRIADLAREERIPPKFLEMILLGLKNQGILQSRKGKGGGYRLARSPADIYLGQIVRMFDGPLAPVPCASQTAYVRCADCRDEAICAVRLAMKEVRDATAKILDGTSIASLQQQIETARPPVTIE